MNTYNYNPYNENLYNNLNQEPSYIPSQSAPPNFNNNTNNNNNYQDDNIYYAENILSQNRGKRLKVYMSFSDSIEWRDKIFEGILEAWGRDFLLLSDRKNNKWYMVWNIYINYIEFNEEVNF